MADPNVFLASIFNATGLAVAAAVSFYVQHRFPRPWFKYWTWTYASGVVGLSFQTATLALGPVAWIVVPEILAVVLNMALLGRTIEALRGRVIAEPAFWRLVAVGWTLGLGALALGAPFLAVIAVPMLALSVGFIAMGVSILRGVSLTPAHTWLAGPLLALGLLPVTFPFTDGTAHAWIGYWAGGVLNLVVGVGMVVSVMELTAHELQAANERLRQHDSLKTNIFNNVSHEIRTPLTAIRAAAVAMEKGATKGEDFSHVIGDQVVRLDRMLSDILDVAQLEAGTLLYAFEEIDLAEVVEAACRMYRPLYAEAGLGLACDVPDDALPITCDRGRLMQVVTNLLENARKFNQPGGQVTVRARVAPGGARIVVSDDGPGVPQPLRETIFEKFYQADGGTTRKVGGAGLGLAICRAIVVDGHGGRIRVEEAPGGGAAFVVELPDAPKVAAPAPASPLALPG